MVAMALKEVLMYSEFLLSVVCGFSKKPVLLLEGNQGLSVVTGASLLLPEHRANERPVWIYLQNPICNRAAIEYLCPESVGNSEKISLALTLQFMFSQICSVLIFQSIMHRYLFKASCSDSPLSWASLYHNSCTT